jgi:glycosyltransferase involved in cell wall biosynthesis
MKICIATDAWHPQINGVVTTLQRTVDTLRGWGHDVLTLTPDGFRSVACPTYPEIRLSLTNPVAIRRLLGQWQPDAVHIATEGPLGWATRAACRGLGLTFTTSYQTRFPEYVRMRFPVPLALSYALLKHFHGAASRTMAAPTIIDELADRGFSNLAPWSRGVDTSLFRPRPSQPIDGKHPLFVYVGRVAPEKNLPAFLDLDLPGEKWVIGDGPEFSRLRRAYPLVRFTGAQRGEHLARLMAAGDVFVFPSLTDTFGIVLLEANACGVPVAAYPVTGPRYLIKEGVNGCLDNDLGRAIMRALALSRSTCREMAMRYTWDVCTRQFLGNLAVNHATATVAQVCPVRG